MSYNLANNKSSFYSLTDIISPSILLTNDLHNDGCVSSWWRTVCIILIIILVLIITIILFLIYRAQAASLIALLKKRQKYNKFRYDNNKESKLSPNSLNKDPTSISVHKLDTAVNRPTTAFQRNPPQPTTNITYPNIKSTQSNSNLTHFGIAKSPIIEKLQKQARL